MRAQSDEQLVLIQLIALIRASYDPMVHRDPRRLGNRIERRF